MSEILLPVTYSWVQKYLKVLTMERKTQVQNRESDTKQNGAPKLIHYGHMEEVDDLFPLTNTIGSYPNSPIFARKYTSRA